MTQVPMVIRVGGVRDHRFLPRVLSGLGKEAGNRPEGICDAKNPLKRLFATLGDAIESFVPETVEEEPPIGVRVMPVGWVSPVSRAGARAVVNGPYVELPPNAAAVLNMMIQTHKTRCPKTVTLMPSAAAPSLPAVLSQALAATSLKTTSPTTIEPTSSVPLPSMGPLPSEEIERCLLILKGVWRPAAPVSLN